MVFNSYLFVLFFLPVAIAGYYILNRINHSDIAKFFLLCMSLWFYAYFNIKYLPILLLSIAVNFGISKFYKSKIKSTFNILLLLAGLFFNLGLLIYCKYLGFFVENINTLFQTSWIVKTILLPLGISFFTFQQIAYIVDGYRGTLPRYSLLDYSLFVAFFPKVSVGPIALHNELIPQFQDKALKTFQYENFSKGLMAFSFGLAKKCIIADCLGSMVDWGYTNIGSLGTTHALIIMLAYTLQIYFDFSGYCDMATGICLMLNLELPMNFDSPYKSLSIADFWNKWHMTLTRFFRTYIYFPLGGNRKGKLRTYFNMFLIFFISGLWHGASWTFILWGALHGLGIVLSKMFQGKLNIIPPPIKWLVTFLFINITWIIFRSNSLSTAGAFMEQLLSLDFRPISPDMLISFLPAELDFFHYISTLIIPNFAGSVAVILMLSFLAFAFFAAVFMKNTHERIGAFKPTAKTAAITVVLLFWSIMSLSSVSTFLYVNF